MRALRHPLYRRLWLATVVSNAGSFMQTVAAGWLVWKLTGSPAWVGALGFCQRAPVVLLAAPAGNLADHADRRVVIICSQVGQAVAAIGLALVAIEGWGGPQAVIALVSLGAVFHSFNGPSVFAMMPKLVPPEDLSSATRMTSVSINLARVCGPALGGLLIAAVGVGACFAVNAASFGAVVAAAVLLPPAPATGEARGGVRAAIAYARRTPPVGRLLVGMALFTCFAAPLQILAPAIAAEVGGGPGALGVMLACFGGGALIGAIALARAEQVLPRSLILPLASGAFAGALAVVALAPTLPVLLAGAALGGMFWLWTFSSTAMGLQVAVTDVMRGRVMGLYLVAIAGPMPFSSVTVGYLAEQIGIRIALLGCALPLLAWCAYALRRRAHAIDRVAVVPA